jgi:uncharacterized protein YcbX
LHPVEGSERFEVTALYRYPVKSMQGESMERLDFDEVHAVGDRDWAVIDPADGKVLSAKRWGALLEASARREPDGTVVLTLPDGAVHVAGEASTDGALSAWLGRPVEMRRAGGGATPYDILTDATDDDSPSFTFAGPEAHWADLAAAHLLTTTSLRAAACLYPEGHWDVRRFRPTVLISSPGEGQGGEGFVEDGWVGSIAAIGPAVQFDVFMPTVRCSMPVRPQPGGLERDPTISRILQEHHNTSIGVYASVRTAGSIAIGDEVVLSRS